MKKHFISTYVVLIISTILLPIFNKNRWDESFWYYEINHYRYSYLTLISNAIHVARYETTSNNGRCQSQQRHHHNYIY